MQKLISNRKNCSCKGNIRVPLLKGGTSEDVYEMKRKNKILTDEKNIKDKKQVRFKEVRKNVLQEVKGDLFTASDDYVFAHCVAEDFRMDEGIERDFKTKYAGKEELLQLGI